MDRDLLIAYLKDIKRIVYNRLYIGGNQSYIATFHELRNLLRSVEMLDDDELLEWAERYEDIKPIDFND